MKNFSKIVDYFFITIGIIIASYAIEVILNPSNILDGGIIGISMLFSHLTIIPMQVYIITLNIPFLIIGYKQLGKDFLIKSIYSIILFCLFLYIFKNSRSLTNDLLLSTAFGGVILGLGIGLSVRFEACIDGLEILAILISRKTAFSVGQFMVLFNIGVYGIASLFFGLEVGMYSLIAYFITSKVMDFIEDGLDRAKAIVIITKDYEELSKTIYKRLGRTLTIIEGHGLINGQTNIVYCVVTRLEIPEIKKIISEFDKSAFVTITDVSEIVGVHIKDNSKISKFFNKEIL